MTSVEGNTTDKSTTINYPTNGLKIRRVSEEDIDILKITDYNYKIKLFNIKTNIFEYDHTPNDETEDLDDEIKEKHVKRKIQKQHSLYRRISNASINLRKRGFNIEKEDLEKNDKKVIVKVINEDIDFIEKYSDFEEIPIDTLLKDTE